MKQTLLFIRHRQTTSNVERWLPGQLPGIALTKTEGLKMTGFHFAQPLLKPLSGKLEAPFAETL
jgi:broad specificity phosphatase PhoE